MHLTLQGDRRPSRNAICEKAPSSKSSRTAFRRHKASLSGACIEAITATPQRRPCRMASISFVPPSSSNSTTSGDKQRIACMIPAGLGQPVSTSQLCDVSRPANSPRSSTTATRKPFPFTGSESCRARSRSKLVLPLAGSPHISKLRGQSFTYNSRTSSLAQPGCSRAMRKHRPVTLRNERTCPSCVTMSPAMPHRQPFSARTKPCCSSPSWAWIA